jgi:hypothetical protein
MSRKTYSRVERVLIALILLGIVAMFQPIAIALYRYGFLLLLFSTIGFIIFSHMAPDAEATEAARPE